MEGGKRPIFDGDLVIVDRKDKGRDGTLVVARLKDGIYICKMLRDDGSGRSLQARTSRQRTAHRSTYL